MSTLRNSGLYRIWLKWPNVAVIPHQYPFPELRDYLEALVIYIPSLSDERDMNWFMLQEWQMAGYCEASDTVTPFWGVSETNGVTIGGRVGWWVMSLSVGDIPRQLCRPEISRGSYLSWAMPRGFSPLQRPHSLIIWITSEWVPWTSSVNTNRCDQPINCVLNRSHQSGRYTIQIHIRRLLSIITYIKFSI